MWAGPLLPRTRFSFLEASATMGFPYHAWYCLEARMIQEMDQRLTAWVESVLGSVPLFLDPPTLTFQHGIGLYLLELVGSPPPRTSHRPPLQLLLRYLVTAWAEEPEAAHRLLGDLVFAAMESEAFTVDLAPLPAATWAAFGLAPRPSFLLCVPLRKERPEPATKPVREPLVIHPTPFATLQGTVLAADDHPRAGVQVELVELQRSTRTDGQGRFAFASVPVTPLTLRVRTREQELTMPTPTTADALPIVIRLTPPNGREE